MDKLFSLKILDRFSWLFRMFGVDYNKMRLIVGFKLTMDKRRVPTIMANQARKRDSIFTPFVGSLLLYGLIGLLLIPFLVIGEAYYITLAVVFVITMFILTTSMISDFSSVLLDVRDKVVLGSQNRCIINRPCDSFHSNSFHLSSRATVVIFNRFC